VLSITCAVASIIHVSVCAGSERATVFTVLSITCAVASIIHVSVCCYLGFVTLALEFMKFPCFLLTCPFAVPLVAWKRAFRDSEILTVRAYRRLTLIISLRLVVLVLRRWLVLHVYVVSVTRKSVFVWDMLTSGANLLEKVCPA
jgi:hypothetical protein